jgi:membrane protein implicated in regulation of membrane protease activity
LNRTRELLKEKPTVIGDVCLINIKPFAVLLAAFSAVVVADKLLGHFWSQVVALSIMVVLTVYALWPEPSRKHEEPIEGGGGR